MKRQRYLALGRHRITQYKMKMKATNLTQGNKSKLKVKVTIKNVKVLEGTKRGQNQKHAHLRVQNIEGKNEGIK